MTTMTADSLGSVSTTVLADGIVVRLGGSLDAASLPELRAALLTERPEGRDDVLVDASRVTEVHERALAILVAAVSWAEQTGGRLQFAAMSPALAETARYFAVHDLLPLLPGPGGRAERAALTVAGDGC
ncbi:anti-sigma-factor antagonist [Acidothermus cellulolyticus 11B]|jgi:anti-anti-sigma regulatory factor|uniref:Anti-sigma-factor antagonist n=1 Tax=Acidothermus cellulolyticus (strain ATCC 43068 / DSM 8971 / 11B) TaxID=351607 RepID=A0LU12_ACIC1|nr:STAS domain-containing protein [Acidothermus cellulolyticus]ABK52922.1 anti-sigma-factor antagonist [Acidothermus cellulolyticus 11B]MBX5447355.1 STAS domain-containing protein [Acidothermus cellulolyticus]